MKNKLFFLVVFFALTFTSCENENKSNIIEVSSIELFPCTLNLNVGAEKSFIITVNPENTNDNTLYWSSDNKNVATVDYGYIKAKSKGTAYITATSKISPDISTKCAVNVSDAFLVSFNSNSSSELKPQTIVSGNKAIKPLDPIKHLFIFGGWYKETTFTNLFDFDNEVITSNVTLYAKWNVILTFNTNGGSIIRNQTITIGSKVTKPEDPTKEGSVFVGWYKEKTLTNIFDFDNEVITVNTNLHAKWNL